MLKPVCEVVRELRKTSEPHEFTLEQITTMFENITEIDSIAFVEYDTPPSNPIWGEFARWVRQPGVYQGFETFVEVRYAKHLLEREEWLRLVVCKELCHALQAPKGNHDISDRGVVDIVGGFSLLSARKLDKYGDGMMLELMAEAAAIELLCPFDLRRDYIAKNGQPSEGSCRGIAAKHKLPWSYVVAAFEPNNMTVVEQLINAE